MPDLVILLVLAGIAASGFGLHRLWREFCAQHEAVLNERTALEDARKRGWPGDDWRRLREQSGHPEITDGYRPPVTGAPRPPPPSGGTSGVSAAEDLRRHRATAAATDRTPAGLRGGRKGRTRA